MSVANPSVMPLYCMVMLTHRVAKEKKLRVWKNYQPTTSAMSVAEKAYVAKVWSEVRILLIIITYIFLCHRNITHEVMAAHALPVLSDSVDQIKKMSLKPRFEYS